MYMARYLNLDLQTTQMRLTAAKESIRMLVAKCEQFGGDITTTVSRARVLTGWTGGWLGPLKVEALLSPHLVAFPAVQGQAPVAPLPLNTKMLIAKLRASKPTFSQHRFVIDSRLYFRGRGALGGSCDTDQAADARAWRGTRGPAVVDADSSDSESNDGSDDGVAAEDTSTDFVKLSSATKAQMTAFAIDRGGANVPAQIASLTADELRSHVRQHCLLRVDGASDDARASSAGAGADASAGDEESGRAPNVPKRSYVRFDIEEIDLDRDGPDSDVIAAQLRRLAVQPPSFRYGSESDKIDLCGAPDPSALLSLALGSGLDRTTRTWTPELWTASVNNWAKSVSSNESSHFPSLTLAYGYDVDRIRQNFAEIQQCIGRLSMSRVYIKADSTRREIVVSQVSSFLRDDDRVQNEATEVLVRLLAVALDLQGREASIRSYLKNNGFFGMRTKRRKALLQSIPSGDRQEVKPHRQQPRPLESRHVPGSKVAQDTLHSQSKPSAPI